MSTPTIPVPAAPVPDLDPTRVHARSAHLLAEISGGHRVARPRRRLVLSLAGGAAAAACLATVVTLVSGVAGPVTPSAFAGWTPTPTAVPAKSAPQVSAACLTALAADSHAPVVAAPWHLVLAEQRGPTRLAILASRAGQVTCLSLTGAGVSVTRSGVGPTVEPAADAATLSRVAHAVRAGLGFTLVEGTAGRSVNAVRLRLADGQVVTASISAGTGPRVFAAWWPSADPPASVLVTTARGTTAQAAPAPGPSARS